MPADWVSMLYFWNIALGGGSLPIESSYIVTLFSDEEGPSNFLSLPGTASVAAAKLTLRISGSSFGEACKGSNFGLNLTSRLRDVVWFYCWGVLATLDLSDMLLVNGSILLPRRKRRGHWCIVWHVRIPMGILILKVGQWTHAMPSTCQLRSYHLVQIA